MFWTYLRRELRRRMRQAVFIALGLALGVGLVITVTSAATGVQNAQAAVLHSLYGVGTDLTVTQPPKQGSGTGLSFGFKQQIKQVRSGQIAAGTKINDNELENTQYGTLTASQLALVSRQAHVTAATGALSLTDITATGTVPALSAGSGTFSSSFTTNTFTVDGVDVARGSPGPLSSASGFMLKDRPPEELLSAIRVIAAGEALLAPNVTRRLIEHFIRQPDPLRVPDGALEELTAREREVLALIAAGLSNAEIAAKLVMSVPTAKTHVSRLLAKLGARDRAQLVVIAYQSGLVKA